MNNKKNCLISIMFVSFVIVSFYNVNSITKQEEYQRTYDLGQQFIEKNGDFSGQHIKKSIADKIVEGLNQQVQRILIIERLSEEDKKKYVNIKQLNFLNFSKCKFDEGQAKRIIEALKGSYITNLDFSNCGFKSFGNYLEEVLPTTNITYLNISENKKIESNIIKNIITNSKLETLCLANCNIGTNTAMMIANALNEEPTVKSLYLSKNKIDSKGVMKIIQALGDCSLEVLDFSNQKVRKKKKKIKDSDVKEINSILSNSKIKIIRFSENSLSEKAQMEIDFTVLNSLTN